MAEWYDSKSTNPRKPPEPLYLRDRRDAFAILIKEGSAAFWDDVRSELQTLFRDKVLQQYGTAVFADDKELSDGIVFLTNGFYGIYRRWFQSELTDDLDYIARLSTRLSTACISELTNNLCKDKSCNNLH